MYNMDMTPEEVLREMEALIELGDAEQSHIKADELLAAFIRSLGYEDIADAYDRVPMWYS